MEKVFFYLMNNNLVIFWVIVDGSRIYDKRFEIITQYLTLLPDT